MHENDCCRLQPGLRAALRRGVATVRAAVVAAFVGLLSVGWASETQTAAAPSSLPPQVIGLGLPAAPAEVERYAITIFPDGRNLPAGRGSVGQGARLYAMHCAACHGAQGIEGPAARLVGTDGFIGWTDPLRPLRVRKYPLQVLSVGAMWPYATTVFDYVRRGMPLHAPKSLSDDEVYAVTAHLLHWNGLVAANAVMDKESLPQVVMPGRARTVSAWPLAR